ncbi:MAG: beta-N-acetylhexosaminidase, partial [Chitinophagaceae bacterium]
MKKLLLIITCGIFAANSYAQTLVNETEIGDAESAISTTPIAIIPEPVSLMKKAGTFILPENISIQASKSEDLKQSVAFLSERIER